MSVFDSFAVSCIVEKMRLNSAIWYNSSESERSKLSKVNRILADALREAYNIPVIYSDSDGTWYIGEVGTERLYDVY